MTTSEPGGRTSRSAEREQFWQRQIEGQAASEFSAREWCLREQLSEPSFYAWRRKLAHRDRERFAAASPASSNGFLPIRLTSMAASNVEFQLPSGLVIRVPAQETAALRAILAFVESRPC